MHLPSKPTLVIVHMQNGFISDNECIKRMGLDNSYHASVVEPNKRILAAARAAKIPIVFTRYSVNAG